MSTVLFYVTKWPSRDLLLDAVKYGDDPRRKFRVELTVRHHSLEYATVLKDVEVLGYQRIVNGTSRGWAKLTLRLHENVEYATHSFRSGIVYALLPVTSRNLEGTLELSEL